MDDRISDRSAEKGSLEPLRLREVVGPFAVRLRESEIGQGVSSTETIFAMNPACKAAIESGSADGRSTSCSRQACFAADDMPWPWIGLKRQNASAIGSTPRGRRGSRSKCFQVLTGKR